MVVYVRLSDGKIVDVSEKKFSDEYIEAEIDKYPLELGDELNYQNGKVHVVSYHETARYRQKIRKDEKVRDVQNILVTTSTGKVFDGDEASQGRMLRAIQIAGIAGETETEWKLADNTTALVTLEELKEALMLAGLEMSRIWLEH
jgi:hypothetical protein